MEKLTNSEFWILWRHKNGKPFNLSMSKSYYLLENGCLSLSQEPSSNIEKYKMNCKVFVNRYGIHALEHHKDEFFRNRWTSIRAWLSLAISIVALIVSVYR